MTDEPANNDWDELGLTERQPGVLLCTREPQTYSQPIVDALKAYAAALPNKRARILFHGDESNHLHEMLIVAPAMTIWPPLLNERPPQSWLVVEGALAFIRYEEPGTIVETELLASNSSSAASFLRYSDLGWYTTVPLSAQTVYLETKPGPHVQTQAAPWGPQSADHPAAADLLDRLNAMRAKAGA